MSSEYRNSTALASLTATYTDSDVSDEESRDTPHHKGFKPSPPEDNSSSSNTGIKDIFSGKQVSNLVSYMNDEEEDDDLLKSKVQIPPIKKKEITTVNVEEESRDSIKDFTLSLSKTTVDNIKLPPEPLGRCSNHLQEKITRHYERKVREGLDLNTHIQKRKDFRNPSIYEKLITFCVIDELGTNYPPDIYDPHGWGEESYYEELAKAQKIEMDKRQKERTKVEFVSGTKKTSTAPQTNTENNSDESKKRKSKWDVGATQVIAIPPIKPMITHPPGIVPVTSTASGTKATVISAFGTITKKAKQ